MMRRICGSLQMINNQMHRINTLTQQLQQIQSYVKAFGDPSKLLQITGADSLVSSLKTSGVGQTIGQLQQAASGVAALQCNANGFLPEPGRVPAIGFLREAGIFHEVFHPRVSSRDSTFAAARLARRWSRMIAWSSFVPQEKISTAA